MPSKSYALSAPVTPRTVGDARDQLLLARAEAQVRAGFAGHPLATRQGDPFSALLDDDIVAAIRREAEQRPAAPADSPFLMQDTRHFSDIIESTIALIQGSSD